jgi:hypothetical protein
MATIKENIEQLENELRKLQGQIKSDVTSYQQTFNLRRWYTNIQEQIKEWLKDPKAILTLGSFALGFILIRFLLSGSPRRTKSTDIVISYEQRRVGWFYEIIRMAIRTFLLHNAQRYLKQYLHRLSENSKKLR